MIVAGSRLQRDLRPGRRADPGRHGARLLCGAGGHPRELAAGAGPVQGLHRDAEVQHVPVAAHDGDRARTASRWRCRSAPTRCTAPPSTASPRTGSTRRHKGATIVGPPAHIDEMTWLRQLLDWQREAADPSEFLDALRFDLSSQEVYVFTPKGDVIALPTGLDAGRLRLRGAHRGRAQVHRRAGQRQAGAAGVDAVQRRRDRDLHVEVGRRPARRRTGSASSRAPGPAPRSGSTSTRSAARRRSRPARRRSSRRCASRACRCSAC